MALNDFFFAQNQKNCPTPGSVALATPICNTLELHQFAQHVTDLTKVFNFWFLPQFSLYEFLIARLIRIKNYTNMY